MLFLRRTAGQSLTFVQNRKVVAGVTVIRVDADAGEMDIELRLASGAISKIYTLRQGAKITFLAEDVRLKLSSVLEFEVYPDAASVGIEAPQSVTIYRSERLTGLGPDQIAALKRTNR